MYRAAGISDDDFPIADCNVKPRQTRKNQEHIYKYKKI